MKHEYLLNNYTNLDLEILPEIVNQSGFEYKLIKRTNVKCLYSQNKGGRIVSYELFKNKIKSHRENCKNLSKHHGTEFKGENYKEYKEVYPSNEEFGKRAWSIKSLDEALQRFEALA